MKSRVKIPLENRYWQKVNKRDPGQCWEWTGAKTPFGHGVIRLPDGKLEYTHRLALVFSGIDLGERHALHRCDNPPCVNPAHLYPGNDKDNHRDMSERGRLRRGSQCNLSRLDEEQVREIRSLYSSGVRQARLVERFGVSSGTISRIVNRVDWKHLP